MKSAFLFCAAIACANPAVGAPPAPVVADSKQPHSIISLAVEPQLNDGRLVIKIAAKNGTAAPAPFGPGSVSITTLAGQQVALSPLEKLVNDVRMAAGMKTQARPGEAPTAGTYASRIQPVATDGSGRMDVTGYSNSSAVGSAEAVRWSKPTIDRHTAETQIAALKQAILQDQTVAPGQIAVGQLVSEKLKFKKGEDRTLHLLIHFAGDEHGFTIAAPDE
jgi:hypothetical protein